MYVYVCVCVYVCMYLCTCVVSGEINFNLLREILLNLYHKGIDLATAQLISHWLLTAEPWVQCQLISSEIHVEGRGTGVDLFTSLFSVFSY
jgi:hypothetical protein